MAVLVRNIDKAVLQSAVLYGYFHRRFPGAVVEAHIASDHRDLDAANELVDQARARGDPPAREFSGVTGGVFQGISTCGKGFLGRFQDREGVLPKRV